MASPSFTMVNRQVTPEASRLVRRKSSRVFGTRFAGQSGCRCQKQLCTKITRRRGPPRGRPDRAGNPRHGRAGAQRVWRPAGLPQADRRAEGPPPILKSRQDHPQLRDMAFEMAPWRRILSADRRAPVPIGGCTSDNGVHVHREANSLCAPALPYVAGCLAVAPRPLERRCRSGACGRGRERPPLWGCLDQHREGLACERPCQPPPGVAPVPMIPGGKALEPMRGPGVAETGSALLLE